MCIDRQKMVDQLFYGLSAVPDSYVPDFHPLANPDVRSYDYEPAEATKMLDSIGWVDPDNDPDTPRIAKGVKGVPNGTPFEFSYLLVRRMPRGYRRPDDPGILSGFGVFV